jgi:hypothetical protein
MTSGARSLVILPKLRLTNFHYIFAFRERKLKGNFSYTVFLQQGADAIKKFTPSLGIPYLGV